MEKKRSLQSGGRKYTTVLPNRPIFSDSVRFLKALPKTGPKRKRPKSSQKCQRSLLSYAEVLYFHFSAQLKPSEVKAQHTHCTCASKKASVWPAVEVQTVTCLHGMYPVQCLHYHCTCMTTLMHYEIRDYFGGAISVTMATKRIFMVFRAIF